MFNIYRYTNIYMYIYMYIYIYIYLIHLSGISLSDISI